MKVIISGKGGCGKSTLSTLIARQLADTGYDILLVDADESNFGLQRLLGAPPPVHLMENFGGKRHFKKNWMGAASDGLFKNNTPIEKIPDICISTVDRIKLMVIGKIHTHGEGCACPMGVLSQTVLSKLDVKENEIVIVDTEAGVEHFGRRVDGECDLILGVVDPSYESFMLAKKMEDMAETAGSDIFFILNKFSPRVSATMDKNVARDKVIARIPENEDVFSDSLEGNPLQTRLPEIKAVCDLIIERKKYPPPKKPVFAALSDAPPE